MRPSTSEIRRTVRGFGDADFVVELEQLLQGERSDDAPSRRAILDLDRLTDRQREVAVAALDRGYFDADGPSAAAVAEDLDVSKATLSQHLGAVERELVRQAFSTGD